MPSSWRIDMTGYQASEKLGAPIPSLDGIRAVSILIVVVAHAGYSHIVPGGLGVTIFFFLSGYLITSLLLREVARSGDISIKHFFARRFLRLVPPLLVTLAIAYGLTASGLLGGSISLGGMLSQLFYFANYYLLYFAGDIPNGTGILWSLAVEEHYYIIYPAFMAVAITRMRPIAIVKVLALVCALALLWRVVLVAGFRVPEERTYFATDTRIDSIMYGCVYAIVAAGFGAPPGLQRARGRTTGFVLGVALILATLLIRNQTFRETLRYSLQGIALIPIFHYLINAKATFAFKIMNSTVMKRIGVYSYAIYLIHFVVFELLRQNVPILSQNRPLLLVSGLCISMTFAYYVDRVVDRPFRLMRGRLH